MSWLGPGALVFASYLLGSVPFALPLGRSRGVDIRRVGSGNIGATNLGRVLGRRWAIGAFLLDYAKGLLPVALVGAFVFPSWEPADRGHLALGCGAAAVAGHILPLYLRFRGGKGVATAFGAMTGLAWIATLAAGLIWLGVYGLTRLVSLASLAAAACFPLGVFLTHLQTPFADYAVLQVFALVVAFAILFRHRENVARLVRGDELGFKKHPAGSSNGDHLDPPSSEALETGSERSETSP